MSSVSVIVVSYNTRDKLRKCLEHLGDDHEVIVVDNASSDGSAEMVEAEFPKARLIRNSRNVGFGAANNEGIDAASSEWVLFLNSDAYAEPGSVEELVDCATRSHAVAAGGALLNMDGSLQESVAKELTLWRVFLEQSLLEPLFRRANRGYWETRAAHRRAVDEGGCAKVCQVMGACLLMRKACGERFDERFFLYCEDTELCRRLRVHGDIVYVCEACFTHELGSSSEDRRWLAVARYNRGKELYFEIHRPGAQWACLVLNRLGAAARLVAWTLVLRFDQTRLFWKVLKTPVRGPD